MYFQLFFQTHYEKTQLKYENGRHNQKKLREGPVE